MKWPANLRTQNKTIKIIRNRILILLLALSAFLTVSAKTTASKEEKTDKRPNKTLCLIYRSSEWLDHYLLQGIDTNYITLPEHSWHVAFTTSMVGIHSTLLSYANDTLGVRRFLTHTTPSFDLGFYVGFRSFGIGYSWDVLHAYSRKLNFSLGSKYIGVDFSRQVSTNIKGTLTLDGQPKSAENPRPIEQGSVWITNTNISLWYALNAAHYSHQAAIKQSYIQKRTAGSLLLHLSYLQTDISLQDTLPILPVFLGSTKRLTTHQVAVGLGYGINYTPYRGVLLHLSANAMLVCYSINQVGYVVPASPEMPGEPMFEIKPRYPVHVTGNLRAAVSWEINPWVHLSVWGLANNIRFNSDESIGDASLRMSNWNWQARLTVGVRFGAGKKRVQEVLDDEEAYLLAEEAKILHDAKHHRKDSALVAAAEEIRAENAAMDSIYNAQIQEAEEAAKKTAGMSAKRKHRMRHTKLPQWITDFFYSPAP